MSTRRIATIGLAILALLQAPALCATDEAKPDKVSFYFAAHEDDWQLFMNPSAFEDVMNGAAKTVFVHMTAGDAGFGMGRGGRKHPFYLARENGAETAIRFMADADGIPAERVAEHRVFNGHSIYRIAYRNTVSYFLRVPDGNALGRAITRPASSRSSGWPTAKSTCCARSTARPAITAGVISRRRCAPSWTSSAGERLRCSSMSPSSIRA